MWRQDCRETNYDTNFRLELIESPLFTNKLGLPPSVCVCVGGGGGENVNKTVPKWRGARIARAHRSISNLNHAYVYCAYRNLSYEDVLSREFWTVSFREFLYRFRSVMTDSRVRFTAHERWSLPGIDSPELVLYFSGQLAGNDRQISMCNQMVTSEIR